MKRVECPICKCYNWNYVPVTQSSSVGGSLGLFSRNVDILICEDCGGLFVPTIFNRLGEVLDELKEKE